MNTIYDIRAIVALILGAVIVWVGLQLVEVGSYQSIGAFMLILFGFFFGILGFFSHGFRPEMWKWRFWEK